MAYESTISPRHVLRKLFPTARLQRLARETGAVVRQRKVKIDALSWARVLGFGIGRVRTKHTKAALEAHAIISVTAAGKQSVEITSERRQNGPVVEVGK